MRKHQTAVALTALFVLAACGQQGGSTPGLTGETRTSFVEASINACTQSAHNDPRNAELPAATITQYCTCYSNAMADKISPDEVVSINTNMSNPAQVQSMLQTRIDAAVTACRPSAPAQAAPAQAAPSPAAAPPPDRSSEPNKGG